MVFYRDFDEERPAGKFAGNERENISGQIPGNFVGDGRHRRPGVRAIVQRP